MGWVLRGGSGDPPREDAGAPRAAAPEWWIEMGRLFGLDNTQSVTYVELLFQESWPRLVILALVLAAIGYAVFLYRRETALSGPLRTLVAVLRAAALSALVIALFDPRLGLEMIVKVRRTVLVLLDTSQSMTTRDARQSDADVKDAALALGKMPFEQADGPAPESARAEAASAPRTDLARGLLGHPTMNVASRLGPDYTVRYFAFGERLEPAEGKGETAPETLLAMEPTGKVTRLGSAIQEAVDRSAGEPIAGVVVLTDGISNDGLEPMAVARRLGERGVPVFPVGLGLPDPPDVRLRSLIVPGTVFHKDRVPVRVEITSGGYARRTANLTVSLDGREAASKAVSLSGAGQFEEILFIPDAVSGSAQLEVAVSTLPGEIATENNRLRRTVRVIDEKIQVLYVEGKPRWEYRYLRQVLLRDHRLEVKFLLTEGDRDQALASDLYLTDFPEDAAKAFHFDLVILGDVPSSYFSRAQLERVEELVQKHGGSFLMLAGHRHAPLSYVATPIASLLPVRLRTEGWRDVPDAVHPVVSAGAADSAVVTLEAPAARNQRLWSLVRPMYKLPILDGAKPGATVLAEVSRGGRRGEAYPLIAWQRYGSGKSLFVGTDKLWRLRFKQGDKYHARFWGQTITFLTLSRLLGENKRIQIETDRQDYRTGQRVQISANVLDELYGPVAGPSYTVRLEQASPGKRSTPVRLEPLPHVPGLYQGFVTAQEAGRYTVRAPGADPALANTARFTVADAPLEQLEKAMQESLLRNMAEASGGRYFAVRDLPALQQTIAGDRPTAVERTEKPLWDLPIVFIALLAFLGVEWLVRRMHDLV